VLKHAAPHTVPSSERASMSRHSSQVKRICEICGKEFFFMNYPCKAKRNLGRFCSRICGNIHCRRSNVVPLETRFFDRVGRKTANGCILWNGRLNEHGYGVISPAGTPGLGEPHELLAHRVAYELLIGPIPDGLFVLHRCDNPPCINPIDLFLGTQADNMADKVAKGRQLPGEMHPMAKLTNDDARAIINRYRAGGIYQRQLAKEYGVGQAAISKIILRDGWKNISEPETPQRPQCPDAHAISTGGVRGSASERGA
jgi:hypothetical protein